MNKRYDEFPAGTYDGDKILLQANALTGALEKISLLDIPGLQFGKTDINMGDDRNVNGQGFSFNWENFSDITQAIVESGNQVVAFEMYPDAGSNGTMYFICAQPSTADSARLMLTPQKLNIKIRNFPEFLDNTTALAGGLHEGDIYRTVDLLKIVHDEP